MALIRAVAVGMVCGLLISGAMFYHKLQLRTLHTVLSSDIDYHVSDFPLKPRPNVLAYSTTRRGFCRYGQLLGMQLFALLFFSHKTERPPCIENSAQDITVGMNEAWCKAEKLLL